MKNITTLLGVSLAAGLVADPAQAQHMSVKLELPQLNVAEYHRPYLALWLEKADQSFVANLNVLYDLKKRENGGAKWLKDMRQWWRRSGRDLQTPVDGMTAATRGAGEHQFHFDKQLAGLAPGEYQVVVEVVREAGGRELLRLPFQWPAKAGQSSVVRGKEEVGAVTLQFKS